jgi:Holliday junction DNA helicase RuvA
MIAYLQGKIKSKTMPLKKDGFLVLNVGGVGYKVFALNKLLNDAHLEDEIELFIYTQVAETALDLYGFGNEEELNL